MYMLAFLLRLREYSAVSACSSCVFTYLICLFILPSLVIILSDHTWLQTFDILIKNISCCRHENAALDMNNNFFLFKSHDVVAVIAGRPIIGA